MALPYLYASSSQMFELETSKTERCAYCGEEASTKDHVVSKALYPPSKAQSAVPRITVPACRACNSSWADDEAHFRDVLLLAGEPSPVVREQWEGKARRSFAQPDGRRRARDLAAQLVAVATPGGEQHMIFPDRDERVLRVVRKTVRGLCHHHRLLSPIADGQVHADIQLFAIQPEFLAELTQGATEADILDYCFGLVDEPEVHSEWLLTYYGRTPFFCIVFRSLGGCAHETATMSEKPQVGALASSS